MHADSGWILVGGMGGPQGYDKIARRESIGVIIMGNVGGNLVKPSSVRFLGGQYMIIVITR